METLKVLGQVAPAATTLTAIYTVPAATSSVVSTLTSCNQNSGSSVKIRVSVAVANLADTPKQYLVYDVTLAKNEMIAFTLGITLAATDVVRVQSDTANVSFGLFGTELT